MCGKKALTLTEDTIEVPHFGRCFVFSMNCENCKYNQADLEVEEKKEPSKYTFEVKNVKDLNVKVVKSSQATVKIPEFRMSATPGPASDGYISNVEGVLNKFKEIVEGRRDHSDDPKERKSAKNLLKKMWKAECGELPFKVVLEDPSGNSAIISDKAKVEKIKKK